MERGRRGRREIRKNRKVIFKKDRMIKRGIWRRTGPFKGDDGGRRQKGQVEGMSGKGQEEGMSDNLG
jgi:hypothetical protein